MSKTILFQGDSITDGGRMKDYEHDLNHQMGHGYAYIVNSTLGAKYPERNLKFINKGISGNRVGDLYARWIEDAMNIKPDILSILVGINDCEQLRYYGKGSDAVRFEKIYRILIEDTLQSKPDIKLVLMEPFGLPVGERKDNFREMYDMLKGYQQATKRIAEDYGAIFVPLQDKFFELSEKHSADYWCWDGIHPTVCGHGIIADMWMERCKDLI